jgi:6-phosphogluconolactonase (cycloisomerase 2 family)
MAFRPRTSWLPGLIGAVALALPAQAASPPPVLPIADPTQQALFGDLFLEAQGAHPSFARDLLPGRADEHLAWFPLQYLVPLANSSTAAAPIPGFPIATAGVIQTPPITLGLTQGTGTAAAALSPSGDACYLAEGNTNNLAGYSVDLATSQFSNVSGAPFASDGNPNGMIVEPSGRFLYVANGDGQTVTEYSINVGTRALSKIGTMPTTATHPHAINATRQCVFVANLVDGGYEVFAINPTNGTLGSVPGSPFGGTNPASSIARTPNGNFVYFSVVGGAGEIDGFFVDPQTCALTPVPGSPFTGPAFGVLKANADVPVLYSAGTGTVQAFAIDPAAGTLSPLGPTVTIGSDLDTGAMVVGPKGQFLYLSDQANQHLRSVALDAATGALKSVSAPVAGPANVESMLLVNENGAQLIGKGIAQNRTERVLGGAPPYTFTLIGGALPAGLSFAAGTGAITGTPRTLGQKSFEVLVTDAAGATSSGVRSLDVVQPPAVPAAPSNLTATASPTSVSLSWQDNANQTAAFQIQLSQDGGPFLEVQAARPQATAAVVNGLSPATSYTFRLRAQNPAGGATDTATATVTTPNLDPVVCTPSANGQCLGNRFLLEAIYQDSHGNAGLAKVVPITADTSYLWFFSPTNVEAVVKVLDGCADGGHFWVFAGGLTNVHVILRLTDTQTAAVRYYEVRLGPAFTPIQDTAAFGTCAFAKSAPGAGAATTKARTAMAAKALRESAIADIEARLRTAAAANLPARAEKPAAGVACSPSDTKLCLNNNRFQVQATFDAGHGNSGTAHVVLLTSDTGYLWFFGSNSVEAVIKVLNACGVNSTYWVFAGGLTNVQVTITVTDTLTGLPHQYNNPSGTTFQPIQDTSTFMTCP